MIRNVQIIQIETLVLSFPFVNGIGTDVLRGDNKYCFILHYNHINPSRLSCIVSIY